MKNFLQSLTETNLFSIEQSIHNGIDIDVDLTIPDQEGKTVLHHAAIHGRVEVIKYVVKKIGMINIKDNAGKTPLHYAMDHYFYMNGLMQIYLLLESGADATIKDQQQRTVLECMTHHRLDYSLRDEIVVAITELVLKLLQATPYELPSNSGTLLLLAAHAGSISLAEELRKRGAVLNPELEGTLLITPAIDRNHFEFIQWLIKADIDINYPYSENGCTALHIAVYNLNYRTVKMLVECGGDVNIADHQHNTLLHRLLNQLDPSFHTGSFASPEEKMEAAMNIFQLLLKTPVLINQKNQREQTPLMSCFQYGDKPLVWPFVRELILKGAELPIIQSDEWQNYCFRIIIRYAVQKSDKEVIETLLHNVQNKEELLKLLITPIIDASNIELMALLIAHGFDINKPIEQKYNLPQRPLEYAILSHDSSKIKRNEFVEFLILQNAEVHFPSACITSVFHMAISYGWQNVVKLLLQPHYHFSVNRLGSTGNQFISPLQCAVTQGYTDIVALLLNHKADPNQRNRTNQTLLHIACEKGFVDIVKLLLSAGADVNATYEQYFLFTQYPKTPLLSALESTHKDKINDLVTLLLKQPNIQVDIYSFASAMKNNMREDDIACMLKHIPEDQLLMATPFHFATVINRQDVVDLLLQHPKASILLEKRNNKGETLLHLATRPGSSDFFHTFMKAGVDPALVDYEGFTVATHALCHGTLQDCGLTLPADFNRLEYEKLHSELRKEPEFNREDVAEGNRSLRFYCYKLIALFDTAKYAQEYIKKYRPTVDDKQPIHDLCLFHLPLSGSWSHKAWATLIINDSKEYTRYLHLAPRIEDFLDRTPHNLLEVEAAAKQIKYNRASENPKLAALFSKYQIPEEAFERVLAKYQPKTTDHLPNLFIDGQELNEPRYYFSKLASDDLRGYILGELTHCCQSVGGAGEACAMHGMTSPYSGFYAIFKRDFTEIERYKKLLTAAKTSTTFDEFLKKLLDKFQQAKYRKQQECRYARDAFRPSCPRNALA